MSMIARFVGASFAVRESYYRQLGLRARMTATAASEPLGRDGRAAWISRRAQP